MLATPLTRDPLHLSFAKSMGHADAVRRFDAAMLRVSQDLKSEAAAGLQTPTKPPAKPLPH
jgi:hypothetical protein